MSIRKKGMNVWALVLKITRLDICGPSSSLNESRQKTDQTVVADTGKRSQQRTGQEMSRIFQHTLRTRQILGRVSDGGSPGQSRDARLNSRSDREEKEKEEQEAKYERKEQDRRR